MNAGTATSSGPRGGAFLRQPTLMVCNFQIGKGSLADSGGSWRTCQNTAQCPLLSAVYWPVVGGRFSIPNECLPLCVSSLPTYQPIQETIEVALAGSSSCEG